MKDNSSASLDKRDKQRRGTMIFMNSTAKIKEEDSVKLVEALEGKYARVL